MTVEVAIIISGLSLAFAVYKGVCDLKRSDKAEASKDASNLTTVIVKLEVISNNISEIKSDMKATNADIKSITMELAKLKQQVRALEKTVFKDRTIVQESGEIVNEH